ncbi:endolytic transglycosylase MltG [Actinocorallia sp. A-T 12471]|uniref:endolytic transglycosylase MltG n=1 Tax=Actinocorallia sp. A-T 12471 TaxID=3089813 RepID=UPI0029CD0E05|nr:endolytic transglycosylase MltG [Actinocorallia sp. A-T 12471]MDX6740287.1 endolytic transglycosylase MltG [Actinocorallia sp. A-T 12471]
MNDDFWGEEPRRESRVDRTDKRKREKRDKRKKRGGGAAAMAAVLFLVVVLGGGGYFGYTKLESFMRPPDYDGKGTGEATIEVKEGDYTSAIAETLYKADVVKSSKAFIKAAEEEPKIQGVQPGFYKMRKQMSATAAVQLILDPAARAHILTIPEGLWAKEIYQKLSKESGIPLKQFKKIKAKNLGLPSYAKGNVEGYLFPGQYNLPPDASATELVKMMVDRFKEQIQKVDLKAGAKKHKMTPGEIITMASVIQAEASKPEDQAKVARVIYNRIKIGRNLEFDTPVMYAHGFRTIDVRDKHLLIDSPYNLYKHAGLPPGPISQPGMSAIEAALNPKPGPWIFFVAVDPVNQITEFGVTEEDFAKLKAKFNKWLEENPQP